MNMMAFNRKNSHIPMNHMEVDISQTQPLNQIQVPRNPLPITLRTQRTNNHMPSNTIIPNCHHKKYTVQITNMIHSQIIYTILNS